MNPRPLRCPEETAYSTLDVEGASSHHQIEHVAHLLRRRAQAAATTSYVFIAEARKGNVMSGWRPLIKGFFAALRLIVAPRRRDR
jgi:hypothetical protein